MSELNPTALALSENLIINNAAALRETLLLALAQGGRTLDLSGVNDCDTAGVQLLVSACKTAQAAGGELVLHAPSAAVVEIMSRYGLSGLLEGAGA